MDYNINAGSGTELKADSFGDGLLAHNRAYLAWLDHIFSEYPELVIENCSSGGMRMDYALLVGIVSSPAAIRRITGNMQPSRHPA
jgi:alpha-galactosidase